jgi:hypothetical protein
MTLSFLAIAVLATALIAAFILGASPPVVATAISFVTILVDSP